MHPIKRLSPGEPRNEEFTYDNWCRNLTKERTFLSSGLLLQFATEEASIGNGLVLPERGGIQQVEAKESASLFKRGRTAEVVRPADTSLDILFVAHTSGPRWRSHAHRSRSPR